MKQSKPVKLGWAVRRAGQPESTPESPSSAEAEMQTDAPPRKTGGRLSREDQRRLGDILQRVYDEVLRQGVPDRFKDLLDQFDKDVDTAETMRGQGGGNDAPDHLVRADSKGSRS